MIPARHRPPPPIPYECSLTVPTRTASDQVPWLAASAGLAGVVELEERRAGYQLAAADPGEQGLRRARCEDRIRCARTGLRNLPLHGYDQNQIWCEIVAPACELLAWTAMLALTGTARQWEPKKLRLPLFSTAGRLVRGGRRVRLRLAARWPRTRDIAAAISRPQAHAPG